MRKSVLGVVLLIAVQTASAAIRYEFRQTTSSDMDGAEATDCSGRAVIGGLMFATVATLFFVPAVFSLLHRDRTAQDAGK